VLTGKSVGDANISLDPTNLTGGAAFPVKDAAVSRSAQQAIVQVDGITITSDTNTLTEAIPGVTIDLSQAASGFDPQAPDWSAVTSTRLNVTTDTDGIKKKVEDFVTAFNDLVKASKNDALDNDSGVKSVIRTLRGKLYDSTNGTGLYQLGVKTLNDGTLEVDSAKLTAAVTDNLDSLQSLLAGDGTTGIGGQLKSLLTSFTSPTSGLLASRQSTIENSLRRIDKEIVRSEEKLTDYAESLYQKFSAMEQLVSSLNSQGSYLTQQFENMNKN
jgi:flagellar hook-associated protein 2